ncbi:diacylglycerol kinase family protein [bacterium]|nr:diacylglycerol kinase family protein [bacterium]
MESHGSIGEESASVKLGEVVTPRCWSDKFRDALRGIWFALSTEKSFVVHGAAAVLVVAAAIIFGVSTSEWAILSVCIAAVIAAEIFNSAIESLAHVITKEHHPEIGNGLNAAAGAVLVTACGAASAGLWVFVPHLLAMIQPD